MSAIAKTTTLRERALRAKEESEQRDEQRRKEERAKARTESEQLVRRLLAKKLGITEGVEIRFLDSGNTAFALTDGLEFYARPYVYHDDYGTPDSLMLTKPCGVCPSRLGVEIHDITSLGYALEDNTAPYHEHYLPNQEEGGQAEVTKRAETTEERFLSALKALIAEQAQFGGGMEI